MANESVARVPRLGRAWRTRCRDQHHSQAPRSFRVRYINLDRRGDRRKHIEMLLRDMSLKEPRGLRPLTATTQLVHCFECGDAVCRSAFTVTLSTGWVMGGDFTAGGTALCASTRSCSLTTAIIMHLTPCCLEDDAQLASGINATTVRALLEYLGRCDGGSHQTN